MVWPNLPIWTPLLPAMESRLSIFIPLCFSSGIDLKCASYSTWKLFLPFHIPTCKTFLHEAFPALSRYTVSLCYALLSLPIPCCHTFITLNRHSGEMEQESWVRRSNLKISFIACCVSQSKWHNFSEPQLFNLWDGTNNSYNNTLPHRTLVVIKQVIINVNTVRSIRILDVIITKLYLLIDFELIECKTNIWPSTGHSAWAYSLPRLVYDRSYHFW